jgi:chitin disaccharide deacetylase
VTGPLRQEPPLAAESADAVWLVVNADDLGCCHGVNRGIAEAHEQGIVTSASLMVDRRAAVEAADYARAHAELGVGLHVVLDRWRVKRLPGRGVGFSAKGLTRYVSHELERQLERFRSLLGRGPTHLDSHQHRHTWPIVRPLFERMARELGVPLRRTELGVPFCGEFYGHDGSGRPDHDAITAEALIRLLEGLRPGVTELGCHPGYADDLRSWYRFEREREIRALCDSRVQETVRRCGIRLCTFSDLPDTARSATTVRISPARPGRT